MSTVVARRVASTPVRSATETWTKITEILAPDENSAARAELCRVAGVACSSIASEATSDAAIVVWGAGPRVRVYCLFDEAAITREDVNEDALAWSATDGDWKMSIPCLPEDVGWSSKQLASNSTRVTARSVDEDVTGGGSESATTATALSINAAEFLKS